MTISRRIALAARVVTRFKQADAVGDPKELLREFNERFSRWEAELPLAQKLQAGYEALFAVTKNPPSATDAPAMREWVEKQKELRAEVPIAGPGSYGPLTPFIGHHWGMIRRIAADLCLAILQQLALPPKTRKGIEAAAKVWSKDRRWKAKARYGSDEYAAEVTAKFLDDVQVLRKYQALFTSALREGKLHSDEGEGATKLKAGSFTLVNTGGFSQEDMARVAKLVEESEERLRRIGLGQVCYGDILVTNRIQAQANVQAFYLPSKDEMFIRADAKVSMDGVQMVTHELTHRYVNKFMPSSLKSGMHRIYMTIEGQPVSVPKIGEEITHKGKTLRVKDYDFRRQTVTMESPDDEKTCALCAKPVGEHVTGPDGLPDPHHPVIQKYVYKMPVEAYNRAAGKDEPEGALKFVTPYAKSGGPEENFCEMVAFYCLGKLPPAQVELLTPLL